MFVVFLVGKAMWVQLDIANEFRNGFVSIDPAVLSWYYFLRGNNIWPSIIIYCLNVTQLPALLSLSTKFVPTIMNILKRLADEGAAPAAPERQRETELQPRNNSSNSNVTSAGSSSYCREASDIGACFSSSWVLGSFVGLFILAFLLGFAFPLQEDSKS